MFTVAPIGNTKSLIESGTFPVFLTHLIVTGSVAAEDAPKTT